MHELKSFVQGDKKRVVDWRFWQQDREAPAKINSCKAYHFDVSTTYYSKSSLWCVSQHGQEWSEPDAQSRNFMASSFRPVLHSQLVKRLNRRKTVTATAFPVKGNPNTSNRYTKAIEFNPNFNGSLKDVLGQERSLASLNGIVIGVKNLLPEARPGIIAIFVCTGRIGLKPADQT